MLVSLVAAAECVPAVLYNSTRRANSFEQGERMRGAQVDQLRVDAGGADLHHGERYSGTAGRPQAQGVDRRLPRHGAPSHMPATSCAVTSEVWGTKVTSLVELTLA